MDCPCTSFPRSFARDYKETYLYPPPSTVYGFLLSLVGEEDLTAHLGVKLAIGVVGKKPSVSRIVRKQRHHKFSKKHLKIYPPSQFSKPNHQELLNDVKVVIRLDSSQEKVAVNLAQRVAIALSSPGQISRFGGLSLGESWSLVNGIRAYRLGDGVISWLVKDNRGLIGLPVWIDRSTGKGTFKRFSLGASGDGFSDSCWVEIQVPAAKNKSKSGKSKKN